MSRPGFVLFITPPGRMAYTHRAEVYSVQQAADRIRAFADRLGVAVSALSYSVVVPKA